MNLVTLFHGNRLPHAMLGCLVSCVFQSHYLTWSFLGQLPQMFVGQEQCTYYRQVCSQSSTLWLQGPAGGSLAMQGTFSLAPQPTLITWPWQQTATVHSSAPLEIKGGTDWFSSSERNYPITDPNVPEALPASHIHWFLGCSSLETTPTSAVAFSCFLLCCASSILLFGMNQTHQLSFLPIWFLSVMNDYYFITWLRLF